MFEAASIRVNGTVRLLPSHLHIIPTHHLELSLFPAQD